MQRQSPQDIAAPKSHKEKTDQEDKNKRDRKISSREQQSAN
jgi:hypothetical protein